MYIHLYTNIRNTGKDESRNELYYYEFTVTHLFNQAKFAELESNEEGTNNIFYVCILYVKICDLFGM